MDLFTRLIISIKNYIKADLVKVFSFMALSTSIKMITSFLSMKVVAVIIGPAGIAMLGQLTNFSTIAMNFASAGINNGVTKYVAEFREDKKIVPVYLSSAFRLTLYCAFGVGILMILFSDTLSRLIMLSTEYNYVFLYFGCTVVFYAVNNFFISVVNGFKQFRLFTYINIANSVVGMFFSIFFILIWGLKGALISVVTFQSVVLIVTLYLLRKQFWFKRSYFKLGIQKKMLYKYLKYTIASLVFIALTPSVQIFLRRYVIAEISEVEAGIWEGMNRISAMYMMIINTSLAVYYIPRLSELKTSLELRMEIIKAYKFIIPFTLVVFTGIYIFRRFIVYMLFTSDFYPMESLFSWQLSLDFINTCSFILSYLLIAKALTLEYTLTSIIFSFMYVLLAYWLLNIEHNVVGIIQGNIIAQLFYFLTIAFLFRKIILKRFHPIT